MRRYSEHAYHSLFYFYDKHFSRWSLTVARLLVFVTFCIRWMGNYGAGCFSTNPRYRQNQHDIAKVIRLCQTWDAERHSAAEETVCNPGCAVAPNWRSHRNSDRNEEVVR
jgi:hypothetical protein